MLNGELGTGAGDVYGDPGYPPTDASIQVLHVLDRKLSAARALYRTLMQHDLPGFEHRLIRHNILPLVARTGAPAIRRPGERGGRRGHGG